MSKNKNYGSFYGKKEPIQETVEVSYDDKTEKIPTKEDIPEVPSVEEPKVENIPTKVNKAVVTGAKKVNMRYKPNKSGQVINIIPAKAKVDILDSADTEWWKVSYKGITGFMMAKFLKEV